MSSNETITDDLVRGILEGRGYSANTITIERQSSKNVNVMRLLNKASKTGGSGAGKPDFIVTDASAPNFVILIECKADTAKHESNSRGNARDFAVDGVLHYSQFVAPEYTVVGIAVSGMEEASLKVSTFVQARGESEPKELTSGDGNPVSELLAFTDLMRLVRLDSRVEAAREQSITQFSRDLHEFIYSYVSLTEEQKPLLVSGTLIALRDDFFRKNYGSARNSAHLKTMWIDAIQDEIDKVQMPAEFGKKDIIAAHYRTIAGLPALDKLEEKGKKFDRGVLHEVVRQVDKNLTVIIDPGSNQFYDVVGQFYGQFLKYTGGDKKALGIVLTPRHVTELFCEIADLSVHNGDKVLDPCTGTGGFLIAAMGALNSQTEDSALKERVRSESLIGIEQNTQMYTLAASNMVLHGDGRSNLYMGSCFDEGIRTAVMAKHPRVGFINPPYAQDKKSTVMSELHFIENMLDMLVDGGVGVAIVPMSCATAPSKAKANILSKHTLVAVMSMPSELFSPVGVVTCIMVFKAHRPHEATNKDTWFGYWKNDGFTKTKHKGRVDLDGVWPSIKAEWLDAFNNQREIPGHSVKQRVTSVDEWCAEAYMDTDYSSLTRADFEKVLRDYALFQLQQKLIGDVE